MTERQFAFLLSYDFSTAGLFCVGSNKKGFNEYRFYDGKWIEDWPEGISFVFDGIYQEEFILGGLHWRLVSDHVRKLFFQENIQGVQFLPVTVIHKTTGKELGHYWVMHVLKNANSVESGYIQNLDIYRVRTSVFITIRLKKLLEINKLSSGAGFLRIPL